MKKPPSIYLNQAIDSVINQTLGFKDNVQLNRQEQQIAFNIMNVMLELQYNGKHSPILKQLFIASMMEINDNENTVHNN